MTFDNTTRQPSDKLSLTELDLYHMIMEYRAAEGLDPIPLSKNLTATAGRHAADTLYNIWEADLELPAGANLHSWSDAPYYSDHSEAQVMWQAPQRIGTNYTGNGYEISAAGYSDIEAALTGWKGSTGHNTVIVNEGIWSTPWNAIGIGVENDPSVGDYGGRIYHVWFGRAEDPDGSGPIKGTRADNRIEGTDFSDTVKGRAGDDLVAGRKGSDKLVGNAGSDVLDGGVGRDKLIGGRGSDELTGGRGVDKFIFRGKFGTDTITDWDGDKVVIDEISTMRQLRNSLSDDGTDTTYDRFGNGNKVIVFEDTLVSDLDLSLFILG